MVGFASEESVGGSAPSRVRHTWVMRLIVVEFMTLDGVMEAPGYEEHRTGRNGWAMEVGDPELQAWNGEQVTTADALLFGRTTYNVWAAFWPTAPEVAAKMGKHITRLPKYVVSRTLRDPDWANTFVLRGDLGEEIRRIKAGGEGALHLYGSADLVGGLLELDLVDELRLAVFPVVLGSGKRLFRDETELRRFRLVSSVATSSGVALLAYERQADRPAPDAGPWDLTWTSEQVEYFRAAEDMDRVLATVLFTDIVDSTGRAAAMGDREWRRIARSPRRGRARRGQALGRAAGEIDRRRDPRPVRRPDAGAAVCPDPARRRPTPGPRASRGDPHRRDRGPGRRHRRDRREHRLPGSVSGRERPGRGHPDRS